MSLLGPSWLTFGGSVALAFALGGTGGFLKGVGYEKGKSAVALAKAVDQAREKEQNWQQDAQTIEDVHDEELRRVADQHVRDLAGLRNRAPSRMPAASEPSCAGASPASLSAPDSSVAVGWGAEFDQLRADYAACKAWTEKVTQP